MPFQKGISGNSKGRPKNELSMAKIIREALEEKNRNGVQYKIIIAKELVELASEGNLMAIREVLNRTDGLPRQTTEHIGDLPIPIFGGFSPREMGVRFYKENEND